MRRERNIYKRRKEKKSGKVERKIRRKSIFSLAPRPALKKSHIENDLLLVFQNEVFVWIQIASVNMTTRSTVKKNSHIDDDLILVLKKQTQYSQGYDCQTNIHREKCQYDNAAHRQKKSHIDDALILEFNTIQSRL
jgi:hypothetical protein